MTTIEPTQLQRHGGEEIFSVACPEMLSLISVISWIAWLNLAIGAISVVVAETSGHKHVSSLLMMGVLSLCVFCLLRMKISYLRRTNQWVAASVTLVCGIYLPLFVLLISSMGLLEVLSGS